MGGHRGEEKVEALLEVVVTKVRESCSRLVPLFWTLQPGRVEQDEGVRCCTIRLDAPVDDLEQAGEQVGVEVDRQSPHVVQHEREEGSVDWAGCRGRTSSGVG